MGRSGSKNIVEGWKRNATKEYFDFLGFSIGAVEELKDDAADIATGVYPQLLGVKGVMGNKEVKREELDKLKFYPLPQNLTPAVKLFLRAKELNFLLYKLQRSLDLKMDCDQPSQLIKKFGKIGQRKSKMTKNLKSIWKVWNWLGWKADSL
jgi:hypothetical protein